MAIILDVKEYCESCLDFIPDVDKPQREDGFYGDKWSDTVIHCKNRNRCEGIKRYLEKVMKDG